mmetsp:Transcript_7557/g.31967  ORF Transcript_7557/g.31967 Transcript_7557/m.31967 type:complete len:431 (+) Transcript_7557:182-1474(+)
MAKEEKVKLAYKVNYKKPEYKGMTKNEIRAAEAQKQKEWGDEFNRKQRAKDAEKAKAVRKQREKAERKVTDQERNAERYEVWAGRDQKAMQFMDRYDYKNEGRRSMVEREIEVDPDCPHVAKKKEAPSAFLRNPARPASCKVDSYAYTPKAGSSPLYEEEAAAQPAARARRERKPRTVPKAADISGGLVQLQYENEVCYWPLAMVTKENILERFKLANCHLKLASSAHSAAALKLKPLVDGRFNIKSGGSYVVFGKLDGDAEDGGPVPGVPEKVRGPKMKAETALSSKLSRKKKKKDPDAEPTPEEEVMEFLTLQRFVRGSVVPSLEAKQKFPMMKEECFVFTEDRRFKYTEFKGRKGEQLQKTMTMEGKFKLKSNLKKIALTYDKIKKEKKGRQRATNKLLERQELYASFHMIGNGVIACTADPQIRFK